MDFSPWTLTGDDPAFFLWSFFQHWPWSVSKSGKQGPIRDPSPHGPKPHAHVHMIIYTWRYLICLRCDWFIYVLCWIWIWNYFAFLEYFFKFFRFPGFLLIDCSWFSESKLCCVLFSLLTKRERFYHFIQSNLRFFILDTSASSGIFFN